MDINNKTPSPAESILNSRKRDKKRVRITIMQDKDEGAVKAGYQEKKGILSRLKE